MADTQIRVTLDGDYDLTDNTETYNYEVPDGIISFAYQVTGGNAKVFMADSATDHTNVSKGWDLDDGEKESKDGEVARNLQGKYFRFYASSGTPILQIFPITGHYRPVRINE